MKNRLIKNSPCSLLDKPKYWNWGFAQTRFVASGDIGILVDGVSVGLIAAVHDGPVSGGPVQPLFGLSPCRD
jgi:hypothetical protein